MNPIRSSLKHPSVALVFTAMVVAVGLHAFFRMPRTEDPSITIRTGLVMAQYPGATSEQVEKQVTKTLENHILKFPEVRKEKTYSTSRPGLVVINVELEDHVKDADLFWAKLRHDLIQAKAAELPPEVRGPIVNSDFGETVAMLIAVHGDRYGYRELQDYTDRIQDELRTIRDVGKISRYGDQSEQVWITSSLMRISQYLTDPLQIIQALQQRNVITGAGSLDAGASDVPVRATGFFNTEDEIENVLVSISKTGQPVYIKDFANVERRYQDPVFTVRHNGAKSVLLSVEMQKGKNIVELGERISDVLAKLSALLPPDIQLDLIADQPTVVEERISTLSHEFLLAIISVVIVSVILLPIRVAMIAALAIPVTLCATLGVMNAFGIQLHQVSIAALIVVLGIVVDDAIVIADNYVELLDRKVPRPEAAWRSATEVFVPVLTATVTIICSFLPLLILTGSVGEFIQALPLTVAIALTVSLIVALLLTPTLCRFFIRKGLHDHGDAGSQKKKFSILDLLQGQYQKAISFLMKHKSVAIGIGLVAVLTGLILFKEIPQQFFPSAERNQFVVDVWMRQGTRIGATDDAVTRIETYLSGRKDILQHDSFIGQSAPRFYYNVNPQQPDPAYAQIIVKTTSAEETPHMVDLLRTDLANLVPEAMVVVKELQQGNLMEAPIEVRISGEDLTELKRLAASVEGIISAVPFSQFVFRDCFNDSYMVDVAVNNEISNRLGLTNAAVSQMLSGAFDGLPVSTFWEGDRPISILLRLDEKERSSFQDVADTYVTSPVTNASVPLRAIASLTPEWQTSRIVRRNGVRTITVRSFVKTGRYASDLLQQITPEIGKVSLPAGYKISYGGETENQNETFPQMLAALAISLVAIFLVLLFQFRTLSEPLIIMSSIPLMLPGAVLGLLITGNSFGFTAFMGLISLTGIVVRNAIILVDYTKEKIREGHSLETAAAEAGHRRLRPIFLTTMAAAVGVTPMILSGSSLWSPLASVIAVGLIFSMFFTLLVVPVLYVLIRSRTGSLSTPLVSIIFVLVLFLGAAELRAESLPLTLPEAVDLALSQNTALKIAQARVREMNQKISGARSDAYPHLTNDTMVARLMDPNLVSVPAGGLGNIPGLGPFPTAPVSIDQDSTAFVLNSLTLKQPLTQLLKIREAVRIANADQGVSAAELKKAEHDIVYAVHQLYCGILLAEKKITAARAAVIAAEGSLKEASDAVASGTALGVIETGSRVKLLQARQQLLLAETERTDLMSELCDFLSLPIPSDLSLSALPPSAEEIPDFDACLREALAANPEIKAAQKTLEKAESGVAAARYDYIPDLGIFGNYMYQSDIPYVDQHVGSFGVIMNWQIFDWGKRRSILGGRAEQETQARGNLTRLTRQVEVAVGKAHRNIAQARTLIDLAGEALSLQRESLRLSRNQLEAGTITAAKQTESMAACEKADLDDLSAKLSYHLALEDLFRVMGRNPEK